jgi:TM2 domain-containing membrane protein YozV
MSRDEAVYDLGDVEIDKPHPVFGATPVVPRPAAVRREIQPEAEGVGPALAGSLSMFVPGLGQIVTGEIAWGLFYLSGMGFCAASLWALLVTLDRLVPMLRLLEVPPELLVVAVTSLALLAMALHLAAVLHAQAQASSGGEPTAPHPIVAGLASLLLPGWGQLLSSHRRRAGLFLAGVWLLSVAWLMVTPAGTRVLSRLSLALPVVLRDRWGPVVMLSAPIVLWVIAVYDAAAGAAAKRNR